MPTLELAPADVVEAEDPSLLAATQPDSASALPFDDWSPDELELASQLTDAAWEASQLGNVDVLDDSMDIDTPGSLPMIPL